MFLYRCSGLSVEYFMANSWGLLLFMKLSRNCQKGSCHVLPPPSRHISAAGRCDLFTSFLVDSLHWYNHICSSVYINSRNGYCKWCSFIARYGSSIRICNCRIYLFSNFRIRPEVVVSRFIADFYVDKQADKRMMHFESCSPVSKQISDFWNSVHTIKSRLFYMRLD